MAKTPTKKKNVGSYPFLSVSFSLSMALLVLGLFGLLVIHAQALSTLVRQNLEIQVHLKKTVDEQERTGLLDELEGKPFVANNAEGEPDIEFLSKEVAAKQFIEETGEDFTEILSINPLRDVYRVKIKPAFAGEQSLKVLKKELESYPEVYEADYDAGLVNIINKNLSKISIVLVGFSLILFITVVILINNTIKLAMFSQRFLIRSMHLVGATDWFIIKPFLERAAFIGLFSGISADVLLFFILNYANNRIEELERLQDPAYLVLLLFVLILMGLGMSIISTWTSVRKFLRLKLDELY